MNKLLHRISRAVESHWVGDGFPVRTLFSYNTRDAEVSPFLMLDYAGPADFQLATKPRGVGMHPHRGFETVTLLYQGEVEHHDSAGNGGLIGPGDVQWMTAARGLLHEEMHSDAYTRKGGPFEAIQLWINLPAQYKKVAPHYQSITHDQIPAIKLGGNGGIARVIAGSYQGVNGPASTYTPINLWDLRLLAGQTISLDIPADYTAILFALKGRIKIDNAKIMKDAEVAFFERDGDTINLAALTDATLLVMSGEPIDEPVAGYGPFVMNTEEDIREAIDDFNAGRFA